MTWSFEIIETSNNAYTCKGIRHTGNTVSIQCGEDVFYKIFKHAFDLEVDVGTLPSQALYFVVSGAKPQWKSVYHDEAFGSWMVSSPDQNSRFIYDGKDFLLMVYGPDEKIAWQGIVRKKEDAMDEIFEYII
jgi:hypothetical protein